MPFYRDIPRFPRSWTAARSAPSFFFVRPTAAGGIASLLLYYTVWLRFLLYVLYTVCLTFLLFYWVGVTFQKEKKNKGNVGESESEGED